MKCDVNTFAQMYEAIYKDLYRFALCMMKNTQDAEDAVSEAVLAAYENIRKLRDEKAFRSWIFTILANTCRKRLKLLNTKIRHEREEDSVRQPGQCPDYDLALDVRKAFFILSEEEQTIVGLSVFGGYNSKEIGGMLRLNDNTVRSKRSRALEKMECILR
ncbi:sigma-70 family RNA polymerase sigma factor [Lachnospiraceae bacterium 50-23]